MAHRRLVFVDIVQIQQTAKQLENVYAHKQRGSTQNRVCLGPARNRFCVKSTSKPYQVCCTARPSN